MRDIYKAAGYKYKWKRKKVLASGLKCPKCKMEIQKGSFAYIKHSKYLGHVSEYLCDKCMAKTKEGGEVISK